MIAQSCGKSNDEKVKIGLLLGGLRDAVSLGRLAASAEARGFDSLWMGDHIAFPAPILDPLQVLTCFAAHTRRVRLGTCVYLLPLRHPAVVAKMVSSLDFLSAGRFIFGIGVGGEFPAEFEACGVPRRERGARANEAITVLRHLWSGRDGGHRGRFFTLPPVRLAPAPLQAGGPPIWIGGRVGASLERAARLGDGYVGHFLSPDGFRERLDAIRSMARDGGRDGRAISGALLVFAQVGHDRASTRSRVAGMLGAMYGQNMERAAARYTVAGSSADCREAVERYREAGVEHLILAPLASDAELEAQIDALADALAISAETA